MQSRNASLIAIALTLLASCSSTPVVSPVATSEREAAAEAAFERGDYLAARDLYGELEARANGEAAQRYGIELARTEIALGEATAALATLDAVARPLAPALQAELAAVQADALFAIGRTVEAVRLLVDREIWLDSSAAILDNQARIWAGLALPISRSAVSQSTGDPVVDGWLALIPLTRIEAEAGAESETFLAELIDWRQRFANHPAQSGILAERVAAARGDGLRPGRIAILLPLGNPDYRQAALAIFDGFYAAHLAAGRTGTTSIRLYDTARQGYLDSYRAAQLDGADFIVGPLDRESVRQLLPEAGLTPTLALNIGTDAPHTVANFYQYALSSDDEIQAIATRAIAEGHETAVILHERGETGRGYMSRFREAFEARGGRIIATRDYAAAAPNLAAPVEELLNITASEARHSRLELDLGLDIDFEPRRRQDIDMIFLHVETPTIGRQLMPLLEGYAAADIPVYTTRTIYDPRRSGGDPDLNGVIFTDIPLLIRPLGAAGVAADLLADYTTQSAAGDRRLFGFGFDAYRLAESLYDGSPGNWPLDGATGELYIADYGRIRRILPLARFTGGRPQALEPGLGLLSAR